ncbi:MAG: nitroreductase family protein [Ardenticatenales bacterium]
MHNPAPTATPIHPHLRDRWSPRAFDPRPVPDAMLRALFEAARWAPSSANNQPWRFVVARAAAEPEAHAAFVACLNAGNRRWAIRAPVLAFACAKRTVERPDRPPRDNAHAWYDLGQAVAHLSVQATAEGLIVHQMAGFDAAAARAACGVPDGFDVVTAVAIGFAGELEALDEDLREREVAPRVRRPLVETVWRGAWDVHAAWADDDGIERIDPARPR